MKDATSPLDTTSVSLLIRLKNRDDDAWERFDRFYLPLVRYWCASLQHADIDEIAQNVALRVHKGIATFDRKHHGAFRAWLRTITLNLIRNRFNEIQRKARPVLDEILQKIAQPTEEDLEEDQLRLWKEAVQIVEQDFSTKWIRCFNGMIVESLTAGELANELDMTEGAVRKAKFMVLKRLKDEFAGLLEDGDGEE